MKKDLFFEKAGPAGTSYADFRFSAHCDACVIRIGDAPPEYVFDVADEVEYAVSQRVEQLTQEGYTPTAKPTLPGVQTPEVLAAITGLTVPARYAKFLAGGPHPRSTVNGINNFADGIPIVFDDPIIPFWLKIFGWDENAPNAIPIALVEESRALSIDANTGEIYVYDNSASEPHVHCYDSLGELLANVTSAKAAKPKKKPTAKKKAPAKKKGPAKKPTPAKKSKKKKKR